MTDKTTIAEVTVGALVRRQFRNELERIKFLGKDIRWHESRTWIGSEFTIRTTPDVACALHKMIGEWNKP